MNNFFYYQQRSSSFNFVGPPVPMNRSTESKIRSFSTLQNGWHYGEGKAPSREMIDVAIGWNGVLNWLSFSNTDAFPGIDGEIMVTAYSGPHYIEILIETVGISVTYEKNGRELSSVERLGTGKAYAELLRIVGEICNTSAYSIPNISTVNLMSSKAWHSEILETEHPSFNIPASMRQDQQSARMSGVTIQMSAANLQSFWYSTKQTSRRIPA
jgi:hypothetical protein